LIYLELETNKEKLLFQAINEAPLATGFCNHKNDDIKKLHKWFICLLRINKINISTKGLRKLANKHIVNALVSTMILEVADYYKSLTKGKKI